MMLSRIADSLFWLNRYMERADSLLRLLYTHYGLALDTDIHGKLTWKPVLETFTDAKAKDISLLENDTERVLQRVLFDTSNNNSLRMILNRARENARGIQDHITKEVWEEVNQMYHLVNNPAEAARLQTNRGIEVIELFQKHTVQYTGIAEITMSRGIGWQFMNLGKLMERCLHTLVLTEQQVQMLRLADRDANDILQWRYLLLALSGYEQHLKTYRTTCHDQNAMHQVLLNTTFTRSAAYTMNHMQVCLEKITAGSNDADTMRLLRNFGKLHSKIQYMDLEQMDGRRMPAFLTATKQDLLQFSRMLGQHFFSYA